MNLNSVILRRKNKVLVPAAADGKVALTDEASHAQKVAVLGTLALNLSSVGYCASSELIDALLTMPEEALAGLCAQVMADIGEMKGYRDYQPMYPNFPQQVIDASDAEIYLNAFIHYFSFQLVDLTGDPEKIWMPKYTKEGRLELDEKIEVKVIGLADGSIVEKLAKALAASNSSLSATDKEDLRCLLQEGNIDSLSVLPLIRQKETLAYVGALVEKQADLEPYFKTATDILRLATAMSDGDVSLAENTRFRTFTRAERKLLLRLLEAVKNKEEDMLRWAGRWVRLGERLHPGEFSSRFPTALAAFTAMRSQSKVETYRSRLEKTVRSGDTVGSIALLSQRPGEFARRLDQVIRLAGSNDERAASAFLAIADSVSTPVLLQVMTHFESRNEAGLRVAFPKGSVAKVTSIEKPLPPLTQEVVDFVSTGIRNVLVRRFSALPAMGKVYLEPELANFPVPFSQRSAGKSLRTLVRGSKLSLGEGKNTVRFFIWWKEPAGQRVDLDLSAAAYGADWASFGAVAFYNLRDGYATHSGDVTSAPNGASEFIDVDIAKALARGIRYVVMTVHGYTEQNFVDLPECFAGFMLREKPQSGEIYDPRTVVDKVDLATAARDGVPLILDLVDRKVIWADAAMKVKHSYHTAATSRGTIALLGKALTEVRKTNLLDLFRLHVEARGTLVDDESEADQVYSVAAGTPFETARIASEFMADKALAALPA